MLGYQIGLDDVLDPQLDSDLPGRLFSRKSAFMKTDLVLGPTRRCQHCQARLGTAE